MSRKPMCECNQGRLPCSCTGINCARCGQRNVPITHFKDNGVCASAEPSAATCLDDRTAPGGEPTECVHEFIPFTKGCSKCGEPYRAEGTSHE
ncbi:hypothetical protein [Pseudomonas sessilinigenes]|uniref:Metallothionein n=1 Tax=Pseudomonas sessilinigenes TaxID=658629 RepID=A0ABX8MSF6_9PSED|nr:hypothetical protein [Pseudomonas sessilinigenes]AZC23198.1 hypothetical protein C4K39_1507 [Pseudomonas sessilinigenes]QXH42214.1 hypothetical protein KSS89_08340 [Pseudomonas sessilinigenes]